MMWNFWTGKLNARYWDFWGDNELFMYIGKAANDPEYSVFDRDSHEVARFATLQEAIDYVELTYALES